jgi:4-carboxymuconolactone decarboxylase
MSISRRDFISTGGALAAAGALTMPAAGQAAPVPAAKTENAAGCTWPADRMPEIPPAKMTEAQKKAADEFAAGRGTAVFGPFVPLLRSPEVMLRAKAMGDYLRYRSTLPAQLNEFAILITARRWTQNYEWAVHQPIAVKAGLKPEITSALAEGRRPQPMSADEELVYEFCSELHQNQSVSDATYQKAVARFGEQGVIDLIGVNGYYTFLAMVLNVGRTALPKGASVALAPMPR